MLIVINNFIHFIIIFAWICQTVKIYVAFDMKWKYEVLFAFSELQSLG